MKIVLLLNLKVSAVCSALPMVKVSGDTLSNVTKLHCQVYGFYPQAVTVRWIKNGIETIRENQADHILPNLDGTYQTILSIEVSVREVDTYSCHVNHSSLEETAIILWDLLYYQHYQEVTYTVKLVKTVNLPPKDWLTYVEKQVYRRCNFPT
ncbi:major histocompatibility complex class I-related gene protein-like isoform X3 [Aquarana catesbeiana]|uniref:major histocompatibility complex class I-related gene protein-like isoform X3 n=1 Tax=Aquarana catesbeiana TaxID=8400 RepID=UPI003CCA52B1